MTYLIIGFVLLMVIAPIFAILPSAAQKQKMQLRKQAMASGIGVELTQIDDPIPKQDRYLSNTGKALPPRLSIVAYRTHVKKPRVWRNPERVDWTVERTGQVGADRITPDRIAPVQIAPDRVTPDRVMPGAESIKLPGTWQFTPSKPANLHEEVGRYLVEQLISMPDDVVKLEEKNFVLSIYWHETSGVDGLMTIQNFFNNFPIVTEKIEADDSGTN